MATRKKIVYNFHHHFHFCEISRLKKIHDVIKMILLNSNLCCFLFKAICYPFLPPIYKHPPESAPSLSKYNNIKKYPGKWKRKLMENLLINLGKIVCCCKERFIREIYPCIQ